MQLGRLHWWEEGDGGWRKQQLGQHLKQVVLYAAVDSGGCRLHPASARRRWGECSHSTAAPSALPTALGGSRRNSAETNKHHSCICAIWFGVEQMKRLWVKHKNSICRSGSLELLHGAHYAPWWREHLHLLFSVTNKILSSHLDFCSHFVNSKSINSELK